MPIRIVRLGTPRAPGEGLRIGTVRRPPRGVPAARFASDDWYDVWYPNLAPSVETVKLGKGARTERDFAAFTRKFRAEMAAPDASRTLDLLAADRGTWRHPAKRATLRRKIFLSEVTHG